MLKLYGLRKCTTCKKAVAWLDDRKHPYSFTDVREEGVTKPQVSRWARAVGSWEKLITLGSVFMAVPLAMFGTDHLCSPGPIKDIVPSWMPAHLFWTYLVGCALLAAASRVGDRAALPPGWRKER